MTATKAEFMRAVGVKHGALSVKERQLLERLGHAETWAQAIDDGDEDEAAETVVNAIEAVSAFRAVVSDETVVPYGTQPRSASIRRDRRWTLLEALHAHIDPEAGRWTPVSVLGTTRWHDVAYESDETRITIEFDSRLSLAALTSELTAIWPQLSRAKIVRRTRPLGDRAIALIRLVCLETPRGTSWADRLVRWNEKFPGWRYPNVSRFNSAFRRAERQLTGKVRNGLILYYDAPAYQRWLDGTPEVLKLIAREDFAGARHELKLSGAGPLTYVEVEQEIDEVGHVYMSEGSSPFPATELLREVSGYLETNGLWPISDYLDQDGVPLDKAVRGRRGKNRGK